jgi:hypothetical protein
MNNKKEKTVITLELGPVPMIVQSTEAFQTEAEGNGKEKKEPKKLYQVSLSAVLDSWQLSLLFAKTEGHTAFFKLLDPSEAERETEDEAERETVEAEIPGAVQ